MKRLLDKPKPRLPVAALVVDPFCGLPREGAGLWSPWLRVGSSMQKPLDAALVAAVAPWWLFTVRQQGAGSVLQMGQDERGLPV